MYTTTMNENVRNFKPLIEKYVASLNRNFESLDGKFKVL